MANYVALVFNLDIKDDFVHVAICRAIDFRRKKSFDSPRNPCLSTVFPGPTNQIQSNSQRRRAIREWRKERNKMTAHQYLNHIYDDEIEMLLERGQRFLEDREDFFFN